MASPGAADLRVYQGDTFTAGVTIVGVNGDEPPDITGWGVLAQIRRGAADESDVVVEITATVTGPQAITLGLEPAVTEALASGSYVWDLELTDTGGAVTTILKGGVTVASEVSRPAP